MLWALSQVTAVYKDRLQEQQRAVFQSQLERLILQPVLTAQWQRLDLQRVTKMEENDDQRLEVLLPLLLLIFFRGLRDMIESLQQEAGRAAWERLVPGQPFPQEAFNAALEPTSALIGAVEGNIAGTLRNMAVLALEQAKTTVEFQQKLIAKWTAFARDRAEMIAATEWGRAEGIAQLLAYAAMGIEFKQWNTVGDLDVCQFCLDNEELGPIPVGDKFAHGEDAPPAHVDCRCNISSSDSG
jgi:hypothetical protein